MNLLRFNNYIIIMMTSFTGISLDLTDLCMYSVHVMSVQHDNCNENRV